MASRLCWQKIAKDKRIAFNHLARSNVQGRLKNGAIKYKRVKFAVFAAGISPWRQIEEKCQVEFPAGKAPVEDFTVNTCSDRAEALGMEELDQFTGVALPDGKEGGHADPGDAFLAIAAQVLEKDVAESDFSDAFFMKEM